MILPWLIVGGSESSLVVAGHSTAAGSCIKLLIEAMLDFALVAGFLSAIGFLVWVTGRLVFGVTPMPDWVFRFQAQLEAKKQEFLGTLAAF